LRYGTIPTEELVIRCKKLGIDALALTDINTTSACMDFIRLAKKHKIKPVLGVDFRNGTLDSMVFIFEYDTLGFYGEPNIKHDIIIERIGERMDVQDTLFSDQDFLIVPSFMNIPIASKEGFVPRPLDSVSIVSYLTDEVVSVQPQLRMQMNPTLARTIFSDTLNNNSSASLQDVVNGFVLKSVPRDNNSMFGINLSQGTQLSGLEVYYLSEDSIKRVSRYVINEVRHQRFTIENESSSLVGLIGQNIEDGSSLFVQGMNGVRTELDVSSLSSIQGKLLNQVQLRIFQNEDFSNDNSKLYPPIQRFILSKESTGEPIDDVTLIFEGFAGDRTTGLDFVFGGSLQDSIAGNLSGYSMDITTYAKEVQAGRENGIMILEAFQKISTPRRVILHGPGHSTLSPELRVTFTEE
ncbi:MAG: DUF4270 family protein, partial [Bacteroidota bacterium]